MMSKGTLLEFVLLIHLDSIPTSSYLLRLQLTWSGTLRPNHQPVATLGGNLPGSGSDVSSSSLTAGDRGVEMFT